MAKRKSRRKVKRSKKVKVVKLDKNFAYVLAGVGMFLAVKGLEGMAGVTGAVIGPAQQTNVTLISFASFFVGTFLAIFAINQLMKKK